MTVEIPPQHEASLANSDLRPDEGWNVLYVDGEWVRPDHDRTLSVRDPSTGDELTTVPAGTEADTDRAFESADEAQSEWADATPAERAGVLREVASLLEEHEDELVRLLGLEAGGCRAKSAIECGITQELVSLTSSLPYRVNGEQSGSPIPGKQNNVLREPVGVVGVITPWNYPLNLALRAIAPALALGNAVVLKPDEKTPVVGGLALARLFEEAGLPDGLFNVVPGRGEEVGDHLSSHEDASVVSFTGSTEVGYTIAENAAENLTPPLLELGGNCPHVVLEDADVDRAIDAGVFGSFIHQGQGCISINRHLVHESLYDEYVERLAERAEALPIGDPLDPETVIGPIIDDGQRDRIVSLVEESREEGAVVRAGGDHDGRFVEPTVLSGVDNNMPIADCEHFGPIAPVIPFETDEEAVRLANDTEYGLAASVHSESERRAWEVADEIDAGMIHLNDQPVNDDPHTPFGGVKSSGLGRYNDQWMISELTETKWVSVQQSSREYPF
ncbi:aldehyde dehydrogenase family protein [Halorussus lipolyticus]|uniref:aldehyde dehydrogenase family protein n=1 Tax=Halorussus lipolyticus TaxID=3034024 RepID=UPI0023E81D21|nr:aldehyde dehydrogenase family protein [Halorussus sp. DT80]